MIGPARFLDPTFEIRAGLDGRLYAVFRNTLDREDYDRSHPNKFSGCALSCFGQYENAYLLP